MTSDAPAKPVAPVARLFPQAATEQLWFIQDAFVRSSAPTELVAAVVRSPERPVALHAAAALQALTERHADAQTGLQECGGIQVCGAAC